MCSRPVVPLPCGRSLRTPSSSNHQETEPRPLSSCFAAPSVSAAWCSRELSSEVVSEAAARSLGTWRGCTHCSPGEKRAWAQGGGPLSAELCQLAGGETGKQNLLHLSFRRWFFSVFCSWRCCSSLAGFFSLHTGHLAPIIPVYQVRLVKAMVFPVVMYGCESWTVKKAEHRRNDAFELWCWRRLLRVPWTARRSNQSILKEISPGISLEGMMLKLKL